MRWLLVTCSDTVGIRNSYEKSWFGGCGCLLSYGENTVSECLSIERMKIAGLWFAGWCTLF